MLALERLRKLIWLAPLVSTAATAMPLTHQAAATTNQWSAPTTLSAANTDAAEPHLVSDAHGNVFAVWVRPYVSVEAARFNVSTQLWSTPVQLSAFSATPATQPDVATDDAGNAVAVWDQWADPTGHVVHAARYSAATQSWGSSVELSTADPLGMWSGPQPLVTVDPAGDAIATWMRSNVVPPAYTGQTKVQSARYTASTDSWGPPVDVSGYSDSWMNPALVGDHFGNATIAWIIRTGSNYAINTASFDASAGTWSSPHVLVPLTLGVGMSGPAIRLAVDDVGIVTAAWPLVTPTESKVQSARYHPATHIWTASVNLSAPGVSVGSPEIAVNHAGNAVAVWAQTGGSQMATYSSLTQIWGSTTTIPVPASGPAMYLSGPGGAVVLDESMNVGLIAPAVELSAIGTRILTLVERFDAATMSWGSLVQLSASLDDSSTFAHPQLVVDDFGNLTAAWKHFDGAYVRLEAARFDVAGPSFTPVSPNRVLDTRPGESPNALRTVNKTKIGGDTILETQFTNLGTLVPATGVGAVSLNVTITNPEANGFLTVYPCDERKLVSNVNYTPGTTIANGVITPVSATGTICFYASTPTDLVVDINGWFPTGPS